MVAEFTWMDSFVILGALEIDSLLDSELQDTHKKEIRITDGTCLRILCEVIIVNQYSLN